MGRYRALWDKSGLLAEFDGDVLLFHRDGGNLKENISGPQVIKDIEPYQNMIDGKTITSRRQHRDLLRAHNCVEVGNDTSHLTPRAQKIDANRRESLHRMLGDVSEKQLQGMVRNEISRRRH